MIEISVNTDILVLGFYGYIGNIGEISVDIFHQISMNSLRYLDFKNRKYEIWNYTLRKLELS